ncbi:MAG: class I SAM-dependent methyltransferase [Deltaproteobacteria bacterium]|nr:class I SAM-dependent methyltransferase [Deltaproteobacteria bacterium]MBW2338823.1 class I SAM-dependent methyltransferase [Deltaproteobacteria bacterium]
MGKFYPESKVEIQGFTAKYYDTIMDILSFGFYGRFIGNVISKLEISDEDYILDLGCGTGRNACLMKNHLSEKGYIFGLDVSEEMGKKFNKKTRDFENIAFKNQRIDLPFSLEDRFDKVFISFVLHGFPHEVRKTIISNAYENLKTGGTLWILDFNEFALMDMPFYYRIPFVTIECPYAFDFIERDWKEILKKSGFDNFTETLYLKSCVRLLAASKT